MSYKKTIFIAIFLFCAGLLLGLLVPTNIIGVLPETVPQIEGLGGLLAPFHIITCVLIFLKNTSALLVSFFLSPILCLIPVFALVLNGWILGLVSAEVAQETSWGLVLAGILPHGIFELPALILGEAAAFSFGAAVIAALFKPERRNRLGQALARNLRRLLLAFILLIPAAVIETYITPLLLAH